MKNSTQGRVLVTTDVAEASWLITEGLPLLRVEAGPPIQFVLTDDGRAAALRRQYVSDKWSRTLLHTRRVLGLAVKLAQSSPDGTVTASRLHTAAKAPR